MATKILSWNVNGLRAIAKKGFLDWMGAQEADIVCLQETKIQPDQVPNELLHPMGYQSYFFSAKRPGYSSVAIYTKKSPVNVTYGMNDERFDVEGRVLQADYGDFVLLNAYFPNSQDHGTRLPYKLAFCESVHVLCDTYRKQGKHVILCGDYNIAHTPIDLARPDENEHTAGYLPEERAWMTTFLNSGYVDAFRHFHSGPGHYSWWSYRTRARERNIGWRIDLFCVNPELTPQLASSRYQNDVQGSDHCPVELVLKSS